MTTAAKPLPPHGTYGRANGSPGYRKPCNCTPCTQARHRRKKQYRINSERGLPGRIDATPAREALKQLRQTMTWNQIADATSLGLSNLHEIASGRRPTTYRNTIAKILAARPQPTTDPNKPIDATGSARRIQALRARGYSLAVLEPLMGSDRCNLSLISLARRPTVRHHVAQRIAAVYEELAPQPAPEGWAADMTRKYAASQNWAPPAAWDDIDDPAARPDWTGYCGSDRGYWVHQLKKLPMCARCQAAHDEWLTEHASLDGRQRAKAMFTARANAMAREADLAADARELLQLRVGLDQAAARLGVTREYLQQALRRHPEDMETAA